MKIPEDIRVLSVRQPWAWAIIHGGKDIENRTWATRFRGLLLIHAGLTVDRVGLADIQEELRRNGYPPQAFPTGVIIGTVTLVDCVTEHPSDWFDGPYGWVLRDPRAFSEPIPCTGRLGLFRPPADVLAILAETVDEEDARVP